MEKKINSNHSIGFYILIFVLISIINIFIAQIAIFPSIPGFSVIYFAVAFMIPLALWFRGWGVLAAYIGCFVGAGLISGLPFNINIYWSLADVWQVLIPLIAFMKLKGDIGLSQKRDFVIFIIFGCVLNNIAGALWGASSLAVGGSIPWSEISSVFYTWLVGNMIITIIITPLLLRFITPTIKKRVQMSGFWI